MAICGYPIVDGSPCHNFPRQGKKYCWMHDGTPKKNERLQAENERLKAKIEIAHKHLTGDDPYGYATKHTIIAIMALKQALTGE